MTIRIHEADGTPYEHIVEIKEALTRFDIPYNTKYKRLKRSRKHKERNVGTTLDFTSETQDDVLLYCLGDVLQTEEEIQEWKLTDWSKEDEDKMSQESYEWIRMDADFEWISKMHMNQPAYMYLSQLQQDRDVVAQLEVRRRFACLSCANSAKVSPIHGNTKRAAPYIYNINPHLNGP
jgi:transcription initiation factor TFIID subunit 2